jgi:hypothetical protein
MEEDKQEIGIITTSSGSQAHKAFVLYANHFLESLPDDHDPIIFFLDGQGSRWTINGLCKLIEKGTFPFFLPSHTSIWAQPNDCKVNRRLHECMIMSAQEFHRASQQPPNFMRVSKWSRAQARRNSELTTKIDPM